MKRLGTEKQVRLASILLLAAAVLFNLHITSPLLSEGVNDAGDDQYHLTQAYYMKKLVLEEQTVFGVVTAYGTGYPWFNVRQWLLYAMVAAASMLSLNTLTVPAAHNILLMLLYSLYPLGVYYFLDKHRLPPLLCGFGALLAPLPISGWGHTLTAYFVLGLSSQVAGALLFPFAVGSFHQLVEDGSGARKTALLYVLTSFAHPFYGYFLVFASAVDLLIQLYGRDRKKAVETLKKASYAGVLAFLLALFWIMPLPSFMQYAPRNLQMQAVRTSFSIESAVNGFVSGELLDVSGNFGDPSDKNLRWPINEGLGRLPVLTFLTAAGIVYALARRNRFSVYALAGFTISFMLLVGSDDLGFLNLMPLSEYANAKRSIFLFEFYSICLSAQVLYWILSAAYSLSKKVDKRVAAASSAVLLLAVLYTPYNERMLTAEKEVNTIDYWTQYFKTIGDAIRDDGIDGRVYGDGETGVNSAPVILSQPWALDMPYLRRIYCTRFWGDIHDYPNIFHIFNVRYLIAGSSLEFPQPMASKLTELEDTRMYKLYRVDGDFGYALLSTKKPALLSSTEDGWRRLAEVWLHYYKNNSRRDSIPLIVQYRGQPVDSGDYSMLMKYDQELSPGLAAEFPEVFNGTEMPHHTVRTAIKDSLPEEHTTLVVQLVRSTHRMLVKAESDTPGLLIHKVRYHPNWMVRVDDGPWMDTLRTTPEYPGVLLDEGTHLVEFRYRIPFTQQLAYLASFITLLYVLSPQKLLNRVRSYLDAVIS